MRSIEPGTQEHQRWRNILNRCVHGSRICAAALSRRSASGKTGVVPASSPSCPSLARASTPSSRRPVFQAWMAGPSMPLGFDPRVGHDGDDSRPSPQHYRINSLTFPPLCVIPPPSSSMRGVVARRCAGGRGSGACAGVSQALARAASGHRPAQRCAREELADGGRSGFRSQAEGRKAGRRTGTEICRTREARPGADKTP